MRWLKAKRLPAILLGLGVALLLADVLVAHFIGGSKHATPPPAPTTTTQPSTTTTTTTAPPPPTTTTQPPPPPPPSSVPMSWSNAGAIIVHPGDVDPGSLGRTMRANGFGWAAVLLADGTDIRPLDQHWITTFRDASGLPVGGWSVLRDQPVAEARAAAQLVAQNGLSFFIADAEAEYGYTLGKTTSNVRYARSRQFVAAFRAAEPSLPAAVSSYCRPDQHDLDWAAWAGGGFVFLPQAYVNDLGPHVAPALCVSAAAKFFPRSDVHPTVGSFSGQFGLVAPARNAHLLAQAGTTGFSIYPAEVGLSDQDWQAYGEAIRTMRLAALPS